MNDEEKWVPIREASKHFGVSQSTLRRWDSDNKIETRRTTYGQRRFCISGKKKENKKKICYCRVSSNKQKDDLERQIKFMREKYKGYEIWYDIGSGINWKRPKFNRILELAYKGDVQEVVVAYRDRLCRFAFELVENVFEKNGVKLVVLNNAKHSDEQELSEDLLSIMQIYICKRNGKRRYSSKTKNGETITKS